MKTSRKPTCKTCDGTGWILSLRSWFTADGYYKSHCGICSGTGMSSYRDDPQYVRFQATARARLKEWGGMKPPSVEAQPSEAAI